MEANDALAIVIVSYQSADELPALLNALTDQARPGDEIVVVDNASSDGSAEVAAGFGEAVRVIRTGANLGFAAGCHAGAEATSAPLLVFLNPDSVPEPGCLDALRVAAAHHPGWGAWQAVVVMPDGTINTDGGVVHFLGMGWAGDCGQPAAALAQAVDEPGFPSGAAMTVRRPLWERLGGMDPGYFLYGEDLDFGLRVWLAGERVGLVRDARVIHAYEFTKGTGKWFWLERNRVRTVLSTYPGPLLLALAPALLGAEIALMAVAAAGGWLPAKVRAQLATVRGLPETLRRRRVIQATRRISAQQFATHLTASLDSPFLPLPDDGVPARLQAAYWALARRVLQLLPDTGGR